MIVHAQGQPIKVVGLSIRRQYIFEVLSELDSMPEDFYHTHQPAFQCVSDRQLLCIFYLDCSKLYKPTLAVYLTGFPEHSVILWSTELHSTRLQHLRLKSLP